MDQAQEKDSQQAHDGVNNGTAPAEDPNQAKDATGEHINIKVKSQVSLHF